MKIVIIENEIPSLNHLQELIENYLAEAKIVATAATIGTGITAIRTQQPDVVFFDVELEDGLSFDILRAFPNPDFFIIFCTAFEHYALRAIRMSALDFLIKPILPVDFVEVLNKLKHQHFKREREKQNLRLANLYAEPTEQKLILKDTLHIYVLSPSDIYFAKADGRYTIFEASTLPEGKVVISQNLRIYEKMLQGFHFYRCHHSYLVNLKSIVQVDKPNSNLILSNGAIVPLSNRKKEGLLEKLNQISIE